MQLIRVSLFLLALVMFGACSDENPGTREVERETTRDVSEVDSTAPVKENAVVDEQVSNNAEEPASDKVDEFSSSSEVVESRSSEESSSSAVLSSSSVKEKPVQSSRTEAKVVANVKTEPKRSEKEEPPAVIESSSSEALPASSEAVVDSSICGDVPKGHFCDYRDGHVYKVVHIGSQTWMAENLNYSTEGSWCYNDNEKNCEKYGRLYTWTATMGLDDRYQTETAKKVVKWKMQGICPDGWHVPSMNEMNVLNSYVIEKNSMDGSIHEDVGTSLKSKVGWEEDDEVPPGSNRYGFSARPAGFRSASATYTNLLEDANFWVADEVAEDPTHAHYWNLYYANEKFWDSSNNFKSFAFSVRCLKN